MDEHHISEDPSHPEPEPSAGQAEVIDGLEEEGGGISEQAAPSQAVEPHPPFPRPADYYASPLDNRRRLPKWVPLTCGSLSIVGLLILLLGGTFLMNDGMPQMMAFLFLQLQGEVSNAFSTEVPEKERQVLIDHMKEIRENLRSGRVSPSEVLPIVQSMQELMKDGELTPAEVAGLTTDLEEINGKAESPPMEL